MHVHHFKYLTIWIVNQLYLSKLEGVIWMFFNEIE